MPGTEAPTVLWTRATRQPQIAKTGLQLQDPNPKPSTLNWGTELAEIDQGGSLHVRQHATVKALIGLRFTLTRKNVPFKDLYKEIIIRNP